MDHYAGSNKRSRPIYESEDEEEADGYEAQPIPSDPYHSTPLQQDRTRPLSPFDYEMLDPRLRGVSAAGNTNQGKPKMFPQSIYVTERLLVAITRPSYYSRPPPQLWPEPLRGDQEPGLQGGSTGENVEQSKLEHL